MSLHSQSHLQSKFKAHKLYKRSKQYFDINRVNKMQQLMQLARRKPNPQSQSKTDTFDTKFMQTFYCTHDKLNSKVQQTLDKSHNKYFKDKIQVAQTVVSEVSSKKSNTVDMNKMLSREYYDKERTTHYNQSNFCNFEEYKMPKNHTVDFQKIMARQHQSKQQKRSIRSKRCKTAQKISQIPSNQLNSEYLGKVKQKLIFDESAFRTLSDYKVYHKYKPQRMVTSPQRHYQRIWQGQKLTSKRQKHQLQFYHGNAKWQYSQMEERCTKQNANFMNNYNKKDKQIEWSFIKRKSDLIQKKKMEMRARKKIADVKGEICDVLFFRRNH